MILFYIFILLASCLALFWAGSLLVGALIRIAKYLGWREFVVAFFVMAMAGSLPNLFVGISSALHKIPQLSLGEIMGGNLVDLTLAIALAVLLAKSVLPTASRMVQTSALFTTAVAILPLLLILDGKLGRGDGLVLLAAFVFYVIWLFSKQERFKKVYNNANDTPVREFKGFVKDLAKMVVAFSLLILAAEGVVQSTLYFFKTLSLSIPIIGILIVGFGNALPEIYFAIVSARKGQNWMVLGNLMGAIIIPATLVLGIVAIISPIVIVDFSVFAIARVFLIIAAIFFLIIVRSGQKITKKEALVLLFLYILFVAIEIFIR